MKMVYPPKVILLKANKPHHKSFPLMNLKTQNMNKTVVAICFFITSLTMSRNISVLTYNIKYDNPSCAINNWDNRKAFLISQLNYNHTEVFGTQEGLLHQLEDIKYGLNDYGYVGKVRHFGDESGEFTAMFYNAKKELNALQTIPFGCQKNQINPLMDGMQPITASVLLEYFNY